MLSLSSHIRIVRASIKVLRTQRIREFSTVGSILSCTLSTTRFFHVEFALLPGLCLWSDRNGKTVD